MDKIKKIIENNQEHLIDTWTLHCSPISKKTGKFLGKLFVTDKNLYFDAQFDSSISGALKSILVSGVAAAGHPLLVSPQIIDSWKSTGFLQIPKKNIAKIKPKNSFFKKILTITLTDDTEYIFDYGMMATKKLETAIRQ